MAHAAWHAWLGGARLCLDLRSDAAFAHGHLAHAVHVPGLAALKARFSTLPARDTPFLVVCDGSACAQVASVFEPAARWACTVFGLDAQDVPVGAHPCFALAHATLAQWATDAGVWRTGDDAERPHLLFRPAPAVERLGHYMDTIPRDAAVLDVGCGAGRDVTYLLRHAQHTGAHWRVTALDRWRAALARAALLLNDHRLLAPGAHPAYPSTAARGPPWADALLPYAVHADGHVIEDTRTVPLAEAALPHAAYDVVLLIRFWHVPFLQALPARTKVGTYVVLSHFVHDPIHVKGAQHHGVFLTTYDAPPPAARIAPDAIASLVAQWNTAGCWDVVDNRIEPIEDGRPVQSVLLRRRA